MSPPGLSGPAEQGWAIPSIDPSPTAGVVRRHHGASGRVDAGGRARVFQDHDRLGEPWFAATRQIGRPGRVDHSFVMDGYGCLDAFPNADAAQVAAEAGPGGVFGDGASDDGG